MKIACPNCGGNVKFIPEKQVVYCDNCKTESSISSINISKLYNNYDKCTCSSCGSSLIVEDNTLITRCPYCNSNQIVKSKLAGEFKPDKIIPFKFGRDKFYFNFVYHVKSNKYFSNDFLKKINLSDIKGIYIPFKKVHVNCSAVTRGVGIDHVANTSDSGPAYYDYYKWFDYYYDFDSNIVFDVSTKVENVNTNSIGPFNYNEVVDFNPTYLCDFSAQIGNDLQYKDLLANEILNISNDIVNRKIQEVKPGEHPQHVFIDMKTKIKTTGHIFNGGIVKIDFDYDKDSEYDVLLPIWFFQCEYENKKYNCLMNGQTGKIVGNLPISKMKILLNLFKIYTIPFILVTVGVYLFTKKISLAIFMLVCLISACFIAAPIFLKHEKRKASNVSEDNLNTDCNLNIKEYNEFKTIDEYREKYNDEDRSVQDITVTNSKDIQYHIVKDNYYHIKYDSSK